MSKTTNADGPLKEPPHDDDGLNITDEQRRELRERLEKIDGLPPTDDELTYFQRKGWNFGVWVRMYWACVRPEDNGVPLPAAIALGQVYLHARGKAAQL